MNSHSILIILVAAVITAALRFFPFIIFDGKKKTPQYITYLGQVLPFALIGMLVIYCLRYISFIEAPYGVPEGIASLVVIVLHLIFKNIIISLGVGTVAYMVLIQFIFV